MEQSLIPPYMGYIGNSGSGDNSAALAAALAATSNRATDSFGGGGIMGIVALMALLGKNGLNGSGDTNNVVLADMRKDIGDARVEAVKTESAIQAAIQVQDTNNQVNFRALDSKICETEKSAIIFSKDALIEALRVEARTSDRLTGFERNVDTNFCDVKSQIADVKNDLSLQIERGFCDLREKTLEDKVAELLRQQNDLKNSLYFSNQTNAINSLLQDQKVSNKVVQFGTGNAAVPTSTSTQNNA